MIFAVVLSDLRKRATRDVQRQPFDVSVSFVVKLVAGFRSTGSYAPKPEGGWRYSKLDPHRAFLERRVAEKPDITMAELAWRTCGNGRAD